MMTDCNHLHKLRWLRKYLKFGFVVQEKGTEISGMTYPIIDRVTPAHRNDWSCTQCSSSMELNLSGVPTHCTVGHTNLRKITKR